MSSATQDDTITPHDVDEETYYDSLITESTNLEKARQHMDDVAHKLWTKVIAPYIQAGCGILDKLNHDRDFSHFYKFLIGSSELPHVIDRSDVAVNNAIEDVNNGDVDYITGESI
jgi:hypothetical protein